MNARFEHRSSDPRPDAHSLRASASFRSSAERRGFTLLELLVVVAVLAVVAGGVIVNLDDVEASVSVDLAQREIAELRQAILRFRKDTGYLPKQGPFDLVSRSGVVSADATWFDCPANLTQLLRNPLLAADGSSLHPLSAWDPDARRGWNGPYLPREGTVTLGESLKADGTGDPRVAPILQDLPGLADPFLHPQPASAAEPYFWTVSGGAQPARRGRPYLVLFESTDTDGRAGTWRVASLGPNGEYEAGAPGSDDLLLWLP